MKDNINHPSHYKKHPSGVECIQITEHMNFCLGSVIKYIWRSSEKGEQLEDLKKAQFCLNREITKLEDEDAVFQLETRANNLITKYGNQTKPR